MIAPAAIRVREYEPTDDDAARELEARCPQGKAFRIVFARSSFHRRTAGFGEARLIGAWQEGRLIAIGGGAIKPVRWEGRETSALLLYDFRVDPAYRREGVARHLTDTLIDWARSRAEIGYAYAVGDNRSIQSMAREWIGADTAPAFELLAYPTHRRVKTAAITEIAARDVRDRHLDALGARPLECRSGEALVSSQRLASWSLPAIEPGGCSVWSTRDVFEEVLIGLPFALRAASWALGGQSARLLGLPHVPRLGERLRSWMLFDLYARDGTAARQLVAAAARRAREQAIDYCHVVLPPSSPLVEALRRDVPTPFAPVLPFTIMARTIAGRPLALPGPAIDPRDI